MDKSDQVAKGFWAVYLVNRVRMRKSALESLNVGFFSGETLLCGFMLKIHVLIPYIWKPNDIGFTYFSSKKCCFWKVAFVHKFRVQFLICLEVLLSWDSSRLAKECFNLEIWPAIISSVCFSCSSLHSNCIQKPVECYPKSWSISYAQGHLDRKRHICPWKSKLKWSTIVQCSMFYQGLYNSSHAYRNISWWGSKFSDSALKNNAMPNYVSDETLKHEFCNNTNMWQWSWTRVAKWHFKVQSIIEILVLHSQS